jgi:hypothetical protein
LARQKAVLRVVRKLAIFNGVITVLLVGVFLGFQAAA